MDTKDELVTILLEVRRGNKVIMRMGCSPRGPAVWSAPTPDADIITPDGFLTEILVLPSLRGSKWQEVPEAPPLPTYSLTEAKRQEILDRLPF
jgi:hypothetical protein